MDVFSYWHSGRDSAPEVVARCLSRWEDLNPGLRLTVLSNDDLPGILRDFPFDVSLLPPQAQADILRIRLLRLHGGMWVDATLLPVLPVQHWFETYVGPAGFFVYSASPQFWRLTNYLILARPRNPFIAALDDRIRAYWSRPRKLIDQTPGKLQPQGPLRRRARLQIRLDRELGVDYLDFYDKWHRDLLYPVSPEGEASRFFPYFWEQYLMMDLVRTDPALAALIGRMTYRLHDACHMLQTAARTLGEDFPRAIPVALRMAPVHKLDWRTSWPEEIYALPAADQVVL